MKDVTGGRRPDSKPGVMPSGRKAGPSESADDGFCGAEKIFTQSKLFSLSFSCGRTTLLSDFKIMERVPGLAQMVNCKGVTTFV